MIPPVTLSRPDDVHCRPLPAEEVLLGGGGVVVQEAGAELVLLRGVAAVAGVEGVLLPALLREHPVLVPQPGHRQLLPLPVVLQYAVRVLEEVLGGPDPQPALPSAAPPPARPR